MPQFISLEHMMLWEWAQQTFWN